MSQHKSSMKIPSKEELGKFKKPELVAFLKARGVPSTGNKEALLKLAVLYADRPEVISDPEVTFKESSSLPSDSVNQWKNVLTEKAAIPSGFTLETITLYLSVLSTSLALPNEEEDETVDVGTLKPVVKGRQMYQSQRLQMAEFGFNSRKNLVFRGNCSASLKQNEMRYPRVVINPQGSILEASCVCPAQADGRCAHVAVLLYLVEDLSFNNTPKIPIPSTSAPQYWGRGKKRENQPAAAHATQYSKKRKVSRYYEHEPRGAGQSPDAEVLLRGVQSLHRDSMFGKLFRYKYVALEISLERKQVLIELGNMYESSMEVHDGIDPFLSNRFGAHMCGTQEQGESELWQQLRRVG